jgi:hypothetical protein
MAGSPTRELENVNLSLRVIRHHFLLTDNGNRNTALRQNYCIFGLCLSSYFLETRKHNVSETGSVSVLR